MIYDLYDEFKIRLMLYIKYNKCYKLIVINYIYILSLLY